MITLPMATNHGSFIASRLVMSRFKVNPAGLEEMSCHVRQLSRNLHTPMIRSERDEPQVQFRLS